MAITLPDTGYCIWTLSGGVWTATSYCKSGYHCSNATGLSHNKDGNPTVDDATFRTELAKKGVVLPSSQTSYRMPCE
jgi:hypothetical protein